MSILSILNDLPLTVSKNPCKKRNDFYAEVAIILPNANKDWLSIKNNGLL